MLFTFCMVKKFRGGKAMPYARYGSIFKKLRTQKNLSMSFFESYGIQKATIQRFETGQSMMSFERLDVALQAMNVSLAEYEFFINNFQHGYVEEFLEELAHSSIRGNVEQIKKREISALNSGHDLLRITAQSCYKKVPMDEVQEVVSYLYQVENWGYFEISIFYLNLDQFSEKEIMHLMSSFWEKGKDAYGIFKYRRRFMEASFRAVVLLSSKGAKQSADKIMKESYFQKDAKDVYVQILRKLATGFYEQCFGDMERGKSECEKYLLFFDDLGYSELATYYRQRQDKLLSKNNS